MDEIGEQHQDEEVPICINPHPYQTQRPTSRYQSD